VSRSHGRVGKKQIEYHRSLPERTSSSLKAVFEHLFRVSLYGTLVPFEIPLALSARLLFHEPVVLQSFYAQVQPSFLPCIANVIMPSSSAPFEQTTLFLLRFSSLFLDHSVTPYPCWELLPFEEQQSALDPCSNVSRQPSKPKSSHPSLPSTTLPPPNSFLNPIKNSLREHRAWDRSLTTTVTSSPRTVQAMTALPFLPHCQACLLPFRTGSKRPRHRTGGRGALGVRCKLPCS
jgi:hypothetical protein